MLELPADVDQKEVEARYKKGILKITLRKTTPKDVKKIEIKPS
jgi:HSP20 family molecular chaperone IbpA